MERALEDRQRALGLGHTTHHESSYKYIIIQAKQMKEQNNMKISSSNILTDASFLESYISVLIFFFSSYQFHLFYKPLSTAFRTLDFFFCLIFCSRKAYMLNFCLDYYSNYVSLSPSFLRYYLILLFTLMLSSLFPT